MSTREVPYYECHITMEEYKEHILRQVCSQDNLWKFSKIEGDPILGSGTKLYATAHFPGNTKKSDVLQKLNEAVEGLTLLNMKVIRKKIEFVIHDDFVNYSG